MNRILASALVTFLLLAATRVHAQDISGDWQGTLSANGAELRLVLHITKPPDGSFKATLDSVDQGANGTPVNTISLKDSKLNFSVDAVHGTYEGKLAPDGKTISGTWTQGQALPLDFKRGAAPIKTEHKPAKPSDIDGTWMGSLNLGAVTLRVVFHIVNTEDGLTATMDSPDQGAKGMPTTSVTRDGAKLKIEAKAIAGVFEGAIAPDLSSIDGTFTQLGAAHPLVPKRVKDKSELELKRPQNPVKPYPYRDEEVSYDNKLQHVTLAATLTIPPGKGPFPGVVLITGSGPQDRDETLLGHKPFLVLSDYLTRRGIVVLRADDRGTGKSTGSFNGSTTRDFADDTAGAVRFLKSREFVGRIGLVGHSEGGLIAPMVASDPALGGKDVDFLVLLAAPGVPGDQIIIEKQILVTRAMGLPEMLIEKNREREQTILWIARSETDP